MFNEKVLVQALKLLKNADPQTWDKVFEQLQAHVGQVTVAVTEASPDRILVCQGHAQEARKLVQYFVDAAK